MANNSQQVRKSINFKAQPDSSGSAQGDLLVDASNSNSLMFHKAGSAEKVMLQSDADAPSFTDADNVDYDNTTSSLAATNVQAAIDEVEGRLDTAELNISNHITDTSDAHDASAISNVPSGGISATDVQAALNELDTDKEPTTAILTALSGLGASTGIVAKTGVSSFSTRTMTGVSNQINVTDGDGIAAAPSIGIATDPVIPGEGSLTLPTGDTSERPGAPSAGMIRFNDQDNIFEAYNGTAWIRFTANELDQTLSGDNVFSGQQTNEQAVIMKEITTPATPPAGYGAVYPKSDGKFYTLNDSGIERAIGSGSGSSKNYLADIVTSQSSTPNIGNGNLESGSTSGWSLGITGALTNGLPSATPTFGSGASGNLSLGVVSSGQLAGAYSMSYTSSAATTQGDMVSSDAFYIDTEDQGKVLSWKFYYKAQTNPTSANWSGTSSNSFGVAVYDTTNGWLSTTANFAMTQSSGVGIASGSFQTRSDTTQLRFVIYNVNATSGAVTLYFDDFQVGPSALIQGAPISDWRGYTPTFTGFGTVSAVQIHYRRVGDSVQIKGKFTCGTNTATEARCTLPSGLLSASTDRIPATQLAGSFVFSQVEAMMGSVLIEPSVGYVTFGKNGAGSDGLFKLNGNSVVASSSTISFFCSVPVTGWSSQVQMSNDTDTRVVAASIHHTAVLTTAAATPIKPTTIVFDTHGAYNATTGIYTVPVSGYWKVSVADFEPNSGATDPSVQLYKNGSLLKVMGFLDSGTGVSGGLYGSSVLWNFVAGDQLSIVVSDASGLYGNSGTLRGPQIMFERLSGPSVIAANELVAARYTTASTQTIGTDVVVNYDTKVIDTHGSVTTGSGWKFTAPVSGTYHASGHIYVNTTSAYSLKLYKNGAEYTYLCEHTSGTASSMANGAALIKLNAGDYIDFRGNTTSANLSGYDVHNYIDIYRVGF